jgi:hypothetical protein
MQPEVLKMYIYWSNRKIFHFYVDHDYNLTVIFRQNWKYKALPFNVYVDNVIFSSLFVILQQKFSENEEQEGDKTVNFLKTVKI